MSHSSLFHWSPHPWGMSLCGKAVHPREQIPTSSKSRELGGAKVPLPSARLAACTTSLLCCSKACNGNCRSLCSAPKDQEWSRAPGQVSSLPTDVHAPKAGTGRTCWKQPPPTA